MTIQFGIFLYIVIILSATFHEFMHGFVAYQLGDTTAKDQGRLTLNPLKHIDRFGTVILPFLMIALGQGFLGWAKPVPYNPYNLSDQKWGSTKVAFAGPLANFIIALLFAILIRFNIFGANLSDIFSWVVYLNIYLGVFNLLPLPPLDGSKLLMDLFPRSSYTINQLSIFGIAIAILFAFWVVSPISNFFYHLFVGHVFIPFVLF